MREDTASLPTPDEGLELLKAFCRLTDADVRKSIIVAIEELGADEDRLNRSPNSYVTNNFASLLKPWKY